MNLFSEITFLLRKEATLELRHKYAISGILLYVTSTVFVIYLSFIKVDPTVWNTLFWIVSLFASINAVMKSFFPRAALGQFDVAEPKQLVGLLVKMARNKLGHQLPDDM